jgi:hypothetical protein
MTPTTEKLLLEEGAKLLRHFGFVEAAIRLEARAQEIGATIASRRDDE